MTLRTKADIERQLEENAARTKKVNLEAAALREARELQESEVARPSIDLTRPDLLIPRENKR